MRPKVRRGETYVMDGYEKRPIFFTVLEDDKLVLLFCLEDLPRVWDLNKRHPILGFSMERAFIIKWWMRFGEERTDDV